MKLGAHRSTSFDILAKEPEFFRGLPSADGGSSKARCAVAALRWSAEIGPLPYGISSIFGETQCVNVRHYGQSAQSGLMAWTYHFLFDEPTDLIKDLVQG